MAAMALLWAPQEGRAQTPTGDALPFAKSYLINGNYVVGGVDVPAHAQGGFASGKIPMAGVPANADILAAFLYWETITTSSTVKAQADGAKFRGQPMTVVKATRLSATPATAACFPSSSATLTMYRADVLRLLPLQLDISGRPTGKRLVNDADLIKSGFAAHTVTVPDAGQSTNYAPVSAGTSLLVIYRDPSQPLTSVVLYDGAYLQAPSATMTQTIRGFFQSSATHVAKMTYIGGSGKNNKTDRLYFKGVANKPATLIGGDKFVNEDQAGNSDRGWSNPTFDVTSMMPGSDLGTGYGEEVVTTVDHKNDNPYDCLSSAAIALSTTVQDRDGDGITDKMEDVSGLTKPNGEPLPDLHAMGAHSDHKDLFVEVGAMTADPGTSYGSAAHPVRANAAIVTDNAGHNHLPRPDVLRMVGEAYRDAPVTNPDGTTGIAVHFDVGPEYHALNGYASTEADPFLVP